MDSVQCQNQNWQTWDSSSHVQKSEERIPLHQQCGVRVLVLPISHQTLCKWEQKKYVLDWHVVPSICPVKIGTNLSRQEVLAFKDVGFQLEQRKALSPRYRFSAIAMFSIPRTDFVVRLTLDAHPTSRFGKSVRRNLVAPTIDH